jgi:hypothetical protein
MAASLDAFQTIYVRTSANKMYRLPNVAAVQQLQLCLDSTSAMITRASSLRDLKSGVATTFAHLQPSETLATCQ